jgi:hypothetical protein
VLSCCCAIQHGCISTPVHVVLHQAMPCVLVPCSTHTSGRTHLEEPVCRDWRRCLPAGDSAGPDDYIRQVGCHRTAWRPLLTAAEQQTASCYQQTEAGFVGITSWPRGAAELPGSASHHAYALHFHCAVLLWLCATPACAAVLCCFYCRGLLCQWRLFGRSTLRRHAEPAGQPTTEH